MKRKTASPSNVEETKEEEKDVEKEDKNEAEAVNLEEYNQGVYLPQQEDKMQMQYYPFVAFERYSSEFDDDDDDDERFYQQNAYYGMRGATYEYVGKNVIMSV